MSLVRVTAPSGVFEHAPVALMVCQVQFEPILRMSEPAFVAPFQDAIRDNYPVLARVGGIQLSFGSDGLKAEQAGDSAAWSFSSSDGDFQVVLAQGALTLQAKGYQAYESFRDRFLDLVRTFVSQFEPGARTRLGLRYVNRFTFEDATTISAWRSLVRPEALGLASASDLAEDDTIQHSFGQTRIAQDESQMIAKYGFLEPGALTHPEVDAPAIPYFVLDLDEFDVRRMDSVEVDLIGAQLDDFHSDIHKIFRWVLTDDAAERLGIGKPEKAAVGSRASR